MAPTDPDGIAAQLDALRHSDQRLVRTVDSLSAEQWASPSVLPGWTRAHVVAHLALNAEAVAGALEGLERGEDVCVYASQAARDEAIEELAAAEPSELRERLFAATRQFLEAVLGLSDAHWTRTVDRLPGGPAWPVAELPSTRRREVEVHHADLDAGYGPGDWPTDFAADLLDVVTTDRRHGSGDRFAVRAADLGRVWTIGSDDPVVEGPAAALGWWLVGRGDGAGLTSSDGALPVLGPWQRAAVDETERTGRSADADLRPGG